MRTGDTMQQVANLEIKQEIIGVKDMIVTTLRNPTFCNQVCYM
jgi:hypothetical protein